MGMTKREKKELKKRSMMPDIECKLCGRKVKIPYELVYVKSGMKKKICKSCFRQRYAKDISHTEIRRKK